MNLTVLDKGLFVFFQLIKKIKTNKIIKNKPALSNSHYVTNFNSLKARTQMSSNILMSLFITIVFLEEMQIISANNNSSVHFVGRDHSSENSTSNTDVAGEGALFVNILIGFFSFEKCLNYLKLYILEEKIPLVVGLQTPTYLFPNHHWPIKNK